VSGGATRWFSETLHASFEQRFEITEVLYQSNTDLQDLIIFETPFFGRILALDGVIQTTERDEAAYHEMLTHVPLLAHGDAEEVLIIGGGDGGALREVLKHRAVKRATEDGIFICQSGVSFVQEAEARDTRKRLAGIFEDSALYLAQVPTYAFGFMTLGWGARSGRARSTDVGTVRNRFAAANFETRYYTPDIHAACFSLPAYMNY
jgi:spermidine synthase